MPFDLSTLDPAQIPLVQTVFWVMTVCTIGGALGVVTSRNLFHSALYLSLSFFGVTGYYVLLSAGFLAVV
jgi:NADH-quinone oxidoreductase subunit J